jgi:autotransporter-associated beta strand protein
MKNRLNPFFGTLVVIAMTQAAHAASATWNGTTDATWAGANWSASPVPGTGDTATFNNAGGAVDVIDLTPNVTVGNIAFDNALVAAYTIGSGTVASQELTLNNSGAISASDTINANQLFNAKLVLGTDAASGSYTITNNDLSNTLTFAGGISGGTTGTAGAKTLTVSTAPLSAGGISLTGAFTNGDASSLALAFTAVSGNVQINLGNTGNTYTGGTSVASAVRLNVNAGAGAGLGAGDVTVASGGQLFLNSAGGYPNNLAISGTAWTGDSTALGAIRIGAAGTILNGNVVLNTNSTIGVDSGRSGIITGNITGAFNLDKTSSAGGTASPLTLTGTNDYSTTTITRGVISFAKQAALYNSTTSKWTKDYLDVASGAGLALGVGDSASGYWDATGVATFLGASQMGASTTTDGFKTGSLIGFDTTNATAGTFTYGAIGNIGTSTLNGVVKLGTGTLVLNAANTYTGATNVDAGTLNLASTGTISGTTVAVSGGTLSLEGALTGTTVTVNSGGTFSNVGGTATFTTNVNPTGGTFAQSTGTTTAPTVVTSGSTDFGFINITGGSLTVSTSINLGRSFGSNTVPSFATHLAAPTTSGLYVNGATAAVSAATLNVGTANSSSSVRVNNGSLNVTGAVTVGKTTSGARYDVLQVSGGTFTAADTTNGIILSPNNGVVINNAELYLSGGVATAGRIAFGASTDTVGGNGLVIVDGGTLYVGASGIVKASTIGTYNYTVGLKSGTLGAATNWSSALNVTLGASPTIKAADAADVARDITLSGVLSGTNLNKSGAGTLTLSGPNTYTGATTVKAGTLALSGARTGTSGGITVADTPGTNATLNIGDGIFALGTNTYTVGNAITTPATATVNQSGGAVSFTGSPSNALILGNAGVAGSASIYNLSGGSITTFASATRGIILGTNASTGSSTFTLSGTGVLNMTAASGGGGDAILEIGRSDATAKGSTTNLFAQTGGTANVGILAMGGNASGGTGVSSTLTLTGGTFTANSFTVMGAAATNTIAINIGGTADVTLPNFPTTALGASSTATLSFDGGTLRPGTTSANYLGSVSSAIINGGGAKIDVASAKDITITQALQAGTGSGGLTKDGVGSLTLAVPSSYTGNTTVSAGILSLGDGTANTALANGSEVIIGTSAVLNLNFLAANSDTVNKLTIDGVQKAAGVWGATGSGAANIDNVHFSGTGTLTVTTGPAGGYTSWASTNGVPGQAANLDHDNDGVSNGVEYFIGGPTGPTTGFTPLPSVVTVGATRSITWVKGPGYTGNYPADFVVETSTTLAAGSWVQESSPGNVAISGSNVTYTFPAGPVKTFARLKVTGP